MADHWHIRRYYTPDGIEWDEVHRRPGYLRRRLLAGDPAPIPEPEPCGRVIKRHGALTEIPRERDSAGRKRPFGQAKRTEA